MSCNSCEKDRTLVNQKYKLCDECNYKRLHKGQSKFQVAVEKRRIKLKKKPTKTLGEKALFLEIWKERPHFCEEENCKKFLGYEPKAWFFSHIKPKSTNPELRLKKSNIKLRCYKCHSRFDFGGYNL
jgi:DNA-directed RNA polymerase subunit RPC12/RpoP